MRAGCNQRVIFEALQNSFACFLKLNLSLGKVIDFKVGLEL